MLGIPEGAREHPAPEPTRRAAAADLPLRVRQDVRLDHLLHQQVRCRLVGAVDRDRVREAALLQRSEEHTSELQSLMRISYAVFCLKKKKKNTDIMKNLNIYTPNKPREENHLPQSV